MRSFESAISNGEVFEAHCNDLKSMRRFYFRPQGADRSQKFEKS